ncbi:hypothetical protein P691DRAFT_680706 [Macrolepiota fuliginosa MF-IS2]|uniref:Uncharacterized protein n=1 Tax=Macrolepiota fuliginosa MF-IS2 TaxID=1400762 RepID=A0A9P5X2J1_9AGAR|nr:hypothetical protein P691DRAFT_680706 [Macrolepiota fuliginosa MF-IS2]
MQRSAALWITGAFHTSPKGSIESIAGLIPITVRATWASQQNWRVGWISQSWRFVDKASGNSLVL